MSDAALDRRRDGGGDGAPSGRARCRRASRPLDRHAAPSAGRRLLRHQGRQPRRPRLRRRGAAGRGGARVVSEPRAPTMPEDAPLLIVPDVLAGACASSRARRGRARKRKVIAVTGSVGKTGTKEVLRLALGQRRRDPRLGRLVQQPLGRAAVAGALPATRATACSRSA